MAKDKPKEQPEPNTMIELGKIQTLIWRLVGGFCVVFFCVFAALGGGFVLLVNADAQQDVALNEKVGNPQFALLLAQVTASNDKQHELIVSAVTANTKKTDSNSSQIAEVDSKVSRLLGIVETFIGIMKDEKEIE
jgi:hypothetical protein